MKNSIILSLATAMIVLAGERVEAQLLYANNVDTSIHLLDFSTGISEPMFDAIPDLNGLAVDDANRIIYWTNGVEFGSTTYDGVVTNISLFNIMNNLRGGLAFDSNNGVLYATENNGRLFTIDTETGAETFIGVVSTSTGSTPVLGGLAYDAVTDQLLASDDGGEDALVSIDVDTMSSTILFGNDGDVDGLAAGDGFAFLVEDANAEGYITVNLLTQLSVDSGPLFYDSSGTFSGGAYAPGLLKSVLIGDINGDGTVDLLDVAPFVEILLGNAPAIPEADINSDGTVDLLDVQPFITILLG